MKLKVKRNLNVTRYLQKVNFILFTSNFHMFGKINILKSNVTEKYQVLLLSSPSTHKAPYFFSALDKILSHLTFLLTYGKIAKDSFPIQCGKT